MFLLSLNLTNLLRKTISTQIYPKITKKFTKHPITQIHVLSMEFLHCLKRERDICIKPMLSGAKMAFRLTPALNYCSTIYREPKRCISYNIII